MTAPAVATAPPSSSSSAEPVTSGAAEHDPTLGASLLEDAPEEETPTSDLFVVSNVGQIRTAALVVRQHPDIVAPRLLVLWTRSNKPLFQTMMRLADQSGLPATAIKLVAAPNVGLPQRIRKMSALIDRLPEQVPTPRLWICNTNSFYGYLAHRYRVAGASVNLFEEGLGSYRDRTDPPFTREPLGRRTRQLGISVRSVLANRRMGRYRQLRRIGHHTARFLADTDLGRRVVLAQVPQAVHFLNPCTRFDRAALAFPTLVDPVLVQAASLERLEMEPDRAELDEREREHGQVRLSEPLFLSQRYGVPYRPWAEAIAAVLVGRGVSAIALKHHPRETPKERADLTLALLDAGLGVRVDPAFAAWTAESLIVESGVSEVIGLTSSTLCYRPYAPWPVRYSSIAREVLDRLHRDPRVHPGSLVHLDGDVRLLERVYPRLDSEPGPGGPAADGVVTVAARPVPEGPVGRPVGGSPVGGSPVPGSPVPGSPVAGTPTAEVHP